jgi:(p)ppGpp synthase/HD superfamily hydrolase
MAKTVVRTASTEKAKNLDQTNCDGHDLEMAISFAVHAHAGQTLEYGGPYILHPLRLMSSVLDLTRDYYLATLAVLHDTVEKACATLDEIEEIFGSNMRADVDAFTRRPGEDYIDFVHRGSLNLRAARVALISISDLKILSFTHPLPLEVQYEQDSRHGIARRILSEALDEAEKAN